MRLNDIIWDNITLVKGLLFSVLKHLFKKPFALLAAALILALAGCGGKTSGSGDRAGDEPLSKYDAIIETTEGSFTIELFSGTAPKTVDNFISLAKKDFYNNVIFHRIVKDFMIQTGDPTGTGRGGPGYTIPDELDTPFQYEPGIVAMANTGRPNSGGSQFFICTGDSCRNLNQIPNYTIFGKVTSGMDTVLKIANTPVTANEMGELSKPTKEVKILTVKIQEK